MTAAATDKKRNDDAARISGLCVAAIAGTVNVGPFEILKLKGAFGRYALDDALKKITMEQFADKLVADDPLLAATIADLIYAQLGR